MHHIQDLIKQNTYPSDIVLKLKIVEVIDILLNINSNLYDMIFDDNSWAADLNLHEFMQTHYLSLNSIEELAQAYGCSITKFKKLFKETFSIPPMFWIKEHRLDKAHELIITEKIPPCKVYARVGFKSLHHFSRCYKEKFGVPPSKDYQTANE